MSVLKKIPGILLLSLLIAGQGFAASSSRFRVHSEALVASDTVDGRSENYSVQARSKEDQVSGQSGNYQMYSSFSTDTQDFVLATTTPVDGNVSSIGGSFLTDDVSTNSARDSKDNLFAEVVEFSDDIPFFGALAGTDSIAITEKALRFVQIHILEPILFLPVDRVTEESKRVLIGIPKGITMNTTPSSLGTVSSIPLPEIDNFDEKEAISIDTPSPITFSGNIDICLFGTPTSTGISDANAVDIFYTNDDANWTEDLSATNKRYIEASDQFCFQTNHLSGFVIGKKQIVVTPPAPTTNNSGGGSGSGKIDRHSYGWNPQSIIAGKPTRNRAFRMARYLFSAPQKIPGKNSYFLWDIQRDSILSFFENSLFTNVLEYDQTPQETKKIPGKNGDKTYEDSTENAFLPSAPEKQDLETEIKTPIQEKPKEESLTFFEGVSEQQAFREALKSAKNKAFVANDAPKQNPLPKEISPKEYFCPIFFMLLLIISGGIAHSCRKNSLKKRKKRSIFRKKFLGF